MALDNLHLTSSTGIDITLSQLVQRPMELPGEPIGRFLCLVLKVVRNSEEAQ